METFLTFGTFSLASPRHRHQPRGDYNKERWYPDHLQIGYSLEVQDRNNYRCDAQ